MIMLQGNVINIAIPRMQAQFGADLASVQWVSNAYLLVFMMLLVTLGRLGDAIGRKRLFSAGLVLYSLGALWNGIASGLGAGLPGLIIGAVVQGAGGAAMMPATQALIAANFDAEERGTALGIWGAVTGLAAAVGPTLGGLLTEYGLGTAVNAFLGVTEGWRYIYFLSAFLGVLILAASIATIPESKDPDAKREYDIVAILLSAAAVFLLVFGLIKGRTYGWWQRKADLKVLGVDLGLGGLSATPVLFALSALLFVALGLWELRRRKERLIDFALFKERDFAAGSASAAILSFAMMGITFLVPVFLQSVLAFSAVKTGLIMLPMALAVAVASPLSGMLSNRFGPRACVATGMAVLGLGSVLIARFSPVTTALSLVLPFVVIGLGIGLASGPITNASLKQVDRANVGGASGLLSMIRQLGSVLGIAIFASAFAGSIGDFSARRIEAIDPAILPPAVKAQVVEGFKGGSSATMGAAGGGAMADGMLAFFPKARAEKIKAAMGEAMLGGLSDSVNATLRYAAVASLLGFLTAFAMRGLKGRRDEAGDGPGGRSSGGGDGSGDDDRGRRRAKGASRRRKAAVVALAAGLLVAGCATTRPQAAPAMPATLATPATPATPALAPVAWTPEARAAFEAEVPDMVKKIAAKKLEERAREQGLSVIDLAFYEEAKKEMNK
jgi:EmrB/QacA subfamily drug resistance transporter